MSFDPIIKANFYWNLVLFAFIPFVIYVGTKLGGLQGVAWSLLGLQMLLLFAWYQFVVKRLLGDCFLGFVRSLIAPIIFVVPMVGVVISIAPFLTTFPETIQLTVQVLSGFTIYVGLYFSFRKNFVKEQLKLFLER